MHFWEYKTSGLTATPVIGPCAGFQMLINICKLLLVIGPCAGFKCSSTSAGFGVTANLTHWRAKKSLIITLGFHFIVWPEGNRKVKRTKMQTYRIQFEHLKMKEDEDIATYFF